jgi:hypothetical protein
MRDPRFAQWHAWERHALSTPEQVAAVQQDARRLACETADIDSLGQTLDAAHGTSPDRWQAFHEAFVAAVQAQPERLATWVPALLHAVTAAQNAYTAGLGARARRAARGGIERWRSETDPANIWTIHSKFYDTAIDDIRTWVQLLIRVAPESGLAALDRLPHPEIADEALCGYLAQDRALIAEMIRAAPRAFDQEGRWLVPSSAVLLLARQITRHAQHLYDALRSSDVPDRAHELASLTKNDLPKWLAEGFSLLLERPDGVHVAVLYFVGLQQAALIESAPAPETTREWSAARASIDALAAVLKRSGVGVDTMHEIWTRREQAARARFSVQDQPRRAKPSQYVGEGSRTLHDCGLAMLLGATAVCQESGREQASQCWSWLTELLVGRDHGFDFVRYSGSFGVVYTVFGEILAGMPNPWATLKHTYRRLEPQRRRGLYGSRHEDGDTALPSLVLLRIGMKALAATSAEALQADESREILLWMHDMAVRLWLTTADIDGLARNAVLNSFAYAPRIFSDALPMALAHMLPRTAVDPMLLVEAGCRLWKNGVLITQLPGLITDAGGDLRAAVCDAQEWAGLVNSHEPFTDEVHEFIKALG